MQGGGENHFLKNRFSPPLHLHHFPKNFQHFSDFLGNNNCNPFVFWRLRYEKRRKKNDAESRADV